MSDHASREPPLRISLTLPGGASLGTFEAGAVCALVATLQRLNEGEGRRVVIDRIAGTSAGALSAVVAARALLTGQDPVPAFRRAWVAAPSLRTLRGRGPWAPLSLRRARIEAHKLISERDVVVPARKQREEVEVELAITSLRGFTFEIKRHTLGEWAGPGEPNQRAPLLSVSHRDWSTHTLEPVPDHGRPTKDQEDEWGRAVDGATASASHPLAFPATRLDRNDERGAYERLVPKALRPERGPARWLKLWYTDGGLLDNEPLGRALGLLRGESKDRVVMIVRAGAQGAPPPEDDAWTGAVRPRFSETLARSIDLITAQAASQNILQAEKVNSRVQWTRSYARLIVQVLQGGGQGVAGADDSATVDQLRDVLRTLEKEQGNFRRPAVADQRPKGEGFAAQPNGGDEKRPDIASLVEAIMLKAAGLEHKDVIDVRVVSNDPAILLQARDVDLQLGGFLDRRRREFDFAAGYWRMLGWLADEREGLANRLDPKRVKKACEDAAGSVPVPSARRMGRRRPRRISLPDRILLGRLAVRVGRIAVGDAVAIRRNRRRRLLTQARRRRADES